MDYSVRDSSIWVDPDSYRSIDQKNDSIYIGIVREERVLPDKTTRYIVEAWISNQQVPISCIMMSRFGGIHNFEEYRLRPWSKGEATPIFSASTYDLRSGDTVVVACLSGDSREGIILGGVSHPARAEKTLPENIQYLSRFNGSETQIKEDGTYKFTWRGLPTNTDLLDLPPTSVPVPEALFTPLNNGGSYWGFDTKGSYTVADDQGQLIKIKKQTGNISIVSGSNRIEIGKTDLYGEDSVAIKTADFAIEADYFDMTIDGEMAVKADTISFKATQIAIGNDAIELFDGLTQLIDALGELVVTSPIGTCTPLNTAPTWVPKVEKIKSLLGTLKTGLLTPEGFGAVPVSDVDNFGDDIDG